MSSRRRVVGLVVAAATSLALVAGAAPGASAAGTTTAAASELSSAERCAQEKRDVKRAKKRLARAKDADKNRAAKVKKAKKNLKKQKRQRARWCAQAADERAATKDADLLKTAWLALRDSAPVQELPTDVRTQMFGVVARVVGLTDSLKTEEIPGATPDELAQVRALLAALHPGSLQDATAAFVDKLAEATSQRDTLSSLLTAIARLPEGTVLTPGSDMARLQKAMRDIVDALAAFQPDGGRAALDELVRTIEAATAELQSSTESGNLQELVGSVTEVSGGEPATEEQLTALLTFLLNGGDPTTFPFELPTDLEGLGALDALLGSVTGLTGGDAPLPGAEELVPEVTEIVTDLIDSGTIDAGDLGAVVDPGGIIGGIVDELPLPPLFP